MADYEFMTVDVFTDRRFGGNPLAVLPDARGLTDAQMQAVAREFNLSETTFVLPPDDPASTARVRIFTPGGELPFAGHPNVGTAFVLARRGLGGAEMVFEELAGLVRVKIDRAADGSPQGAMVAAPRTLTVGAEVTVEATAAMAELAEGDVRTEAHYPVVAGVGTPFLIAELIDMTALAAARPVAAAFETAAEAIPDLGTGLALLVYVRDADDPTKLSARCFSPLMGIPEDPATGSAVGALAALLASLAPGADVELTFDVTQGVEMGRPSRIFAVGSKSAEGGVRATVAGRCVPVSGGRIEV
jgi:trans-2,3-dihydro-3-hydroxyanthranilate isomerase